MPWWKDFAQAEPDLAARVRALFAVRKHATLATLRSDGAPRISGTEVSFEDDDLAIGSMLDAVKALDLRRDPRFALHCPTVDADEGKESEWAGDAKIAGLAHEVQETPEDGAVEDGAVPDSHKFRLEITEVVLVKVGDPADHLLIESWHPDRGRVLRKRA
jgi:Pyridoxamine 5'-phosphate oxidase